MIISIVYIGSANKLREIVYHTCSLCFPQRGCSVAILHFPFRIDFPSISVSTWLTFFFMNENIFYLHVEPFSSYPPGLKDSSDIIIHHLFFTLYVYIPIHSLRAIRFCFCGNSIPLHLGIKVYNKYLYGCRKTFYYVNAFVAFQENKRNFLANPFEKSFNRHRAYKEICADSLLGDEELARNIFLIEFEFSSKFLFINKPALCKTNFFSISCLRSWRERNMKKIAENKKYFKKFMRPKSALGRCVWITFYRNMIHVKARMNLPTITRARVIAHKTRWKNQ